MAAVQPGCVELIAEAERLLHEAGGYARRAVGEPPPPPPVAGS